MSTVMGTESPKRYTCGRYEILQIVAEPVYDGKWIAMLDRSVGAVSSDPEEVVRDLVRIMKRKSENESFPLPNALHVLFVDALYGRDSLKCSIMTGIKDADNPETKEGPSMSNTDKETPETAVLDQNQFLTAQTLLDAVFELPGVWDRVDAYMRGRGVEDPEVEVRSLRDAVY